MGIPQIEAINQGVYAAMNSVAQIYAWLCAVFNKIADALLESDQQEQEYLRSLTPEQRIEYLDLKSSIQYDRD